jgi:hypothetical protein
VSTHNLRTFIEKPRLFRRGTTPARLRSTAAMIASDA